jgi:aminopeptidase
MHDKRVAEHARILIDYSTAVKSGDYVVVSTNGDALPLIREIAAEVAKKGAYLSVILQENSVTRAYLMNAEDSTLEVLPRQTKMMLENLDVFIQVLASTNSQEMSDVPPSKLKANMKSMGPVLGIMFQKRWNVTLHPTPALAQDAKKSYESYCDFVYNATLRDWSKMGKEMKVLAIRWLRPKKLG